MNTHTPEKRPDGDLLAAVRTLYERNETDNGNGGVHSSHVAAYLNASETWTRSRLRTLAERGDLESVQGIDPESGLSRRSYVPVDDE